MDRSDTIDIIRLIWWILICVFWVGFIRSWYINEKVYTEVMEIREARKIEWISVSPKLDKRENDYILWLNKVMKGQENAKSL